MSVVKKCYKRCSNFKYYHTFLFGQVHCETHLSSSDYDNNDGKSNNWENITCEFYKPFGMWFFIDFFKKRSEWIKQHKELTGE